MDNHNQSQMTPSQAFGFGMPWKASLWYFILAWILHWKNVGDVIIRFRREDGQIYDSVNNNKVYIDAFLPIYWY